MVKKSKFDQFFTRPDVAKTCLDLLYNTISISDDLSFIEPSAGEGAFSSQIKNCISVDIDPKFEGVIKADFLTLKKTDLTEKESKSLIVIGNPPFGRISSLAVKFFNHATNFADTVAFIVPRTFKKNSIKKRLNPYYHLIKEMDLPKNSFILFGSNYDVPCVFQIWKKLPEKRELLLTYESPYFSFVKKNNADFAIRRVGGQTGKIIWDYNSVSESSHYFIKAKIITPSELARYIKSLDFSNYINSTAGVRSLSKSEIYYEFEKQSGNIVNITK